MRRTPSRTLAATIVAFAFVAAVLPLALAAPGLFSVSRTAVSDRATQGLSAAARQISLRLGSGVADQWSELRAVASWAAADGIGGAFPLRLDTVRAVNSNLAWMGVASPEGRVLAATGRLLEGQDVSARPWFRAGLQGDFAGDLHEAVMLQRLLGPRPGAEPLRLIDFAMPVRRPDGSLLGVIGSHVDWQWIRDRVRGAPLPAGTDALLVARDGTVIVGPPEVEGQKLTLRSVLAGGQGVGVVTEETWPDGRLYLTVGAPAGTAAGLPGFGWVVIVRQAPEAALGGIRALTLAIGLPVLGGAVLVFLAGIALSRWLGRPFAQLADSATALAAGRLDAPVPEFRRTREAALLSAALARLDRGAPRTPPSDGGHP